jgi:hypothetical protein
MQYPKQALMNLFDQRRILRRAGRMTIAPIR